MYSCGVTDSPGTKSLIHFNDVFILISFLLRADSRTFGSGVVRQSPDNPVCANLSFFASKLAEIQIHTSLSALLVAYAKIGLKISDRFRIAGACRRSHI